MKLTENKIYWNNGQLSRHWFADDDSVIQGVEYRYREDGMAWDVVNWLDGERHGEYIIYGLAGNIFRHDVYINGKFYCEYYQLSEMDKFELSLRHGIIWL